MKQMMKKEKSNLAKGLIFSIIFLGSFFLFDKNAKAADISSTATGGAWATGSSWTGGVAPISTDNAIIVSGATVTLGAAANITNVTINSGGTLALGAYNLTASGDFQNDGALTAAAAGILTMTGSSSQIKGSVSTTFKNLTINTSGKVTINTDTSVNRDTKITGNLEVASGKILNLNQNGANSLTIYSNSTLSGTGTATVYSAPQELGGVMNLASPSITLTDGTSTIKVVTFTYDITAWTWWGGSGSEMHMNIAGVTYGTDANPTNVKLIGRNGNATATFHYDLGGNTTIKGNLTFVSADSYPNIFLSTGSYNLAVGGNFTLGDNDGSNAKLYSFTGGSGTLDINGNLTIQKGSAETVTFTGPSGTGASAFTLAGNYSNTGTFTNNSGTLTLDGSSQQVLSNTMTGTSAFYNLTIANSSGANASDFERTSFNPSVKFSADATVNNTFTITTNHVRVEYNSGSTYTFKDINWSGGSGTDMLYFRNSATSGTWLLKVTGTQTAVHYVNVSRSDASVSGGSVITATDGTNYDANNNTNWNFGSGGSLSFDIVDSGGASVSSPAVTFAGKSFSWLAQQSTGTLGTSSQKLRVSNSRNTKSWTLSIAATSGSGALWTSGGDTYDFNGSAANGRLQVDASGGTLTPQTNCPSTGLSKGSATYFNQGVTDSITILSATGSAYTNCYWDLTGISLTQDIPASQKGGNYSLNMTITAS